MIELDAREVSRVAGDVGDAGVRDEALGAVALADLDFLDAQVVSDRLVAALARERGLGVG